MIIEIKRDIKDESVTIPKGTRGLVKGVQWGEKKDGYVVDFPQSSGVFISREDAIVLAVEKVVEKKSTFKTHANYEEVEKEIKGNKQAREEEL